MVSPDGKLEAIGGPVSQYARRGDQVVKLEDICPLQTGLDLDITHITGVEPAFAETRVGCPVATVPCSFGASHGKVIDETLASGRRPFRGRSVLGIVRLSGPL